MYCCENSRGSDAEHLLFVCRAWEETQACVTRNYAFCSSGYRAAVDYTVALYRQIMGRACVDLCFIESASGCVSRVTSLVAPLITVDPDFSISFEFCT